MGSVIRNVIVNKSVVNTYSYLRGNYSEEDFEVSFKNDSKFEIVNTSDVNFNFEKLMNDDEINEICKKVNNGVDDSVIESFYSGKFVNIKFENSSMIDIKNIINSDLSTSFFNVSGDGDSDLYFYSEILGDNGQFNYFYNINLEGNSKVKLIVFLKSTSKGFINIFGNCYNQSNLEILFINLNKNNVYINCKINLNGEKSLANINTCYICPPKCKFDYNLTLSMIGKESTGKINGKGVLLNGSHKIFRGTIDFQKGCVNSKGHENEEVIILGKTVKNQSLPLLLCNEKNVEGSHGFSANSIDEDKVFYLLSRGFNKKQARALILRGKFLNLFREINREDIVNEFLNLLMEAI